MNVVVITGSTRGLGYGLAEAFLRRGHAVVINGRNVNQVANVVARLGMQFDPMRVFGHPADVTRPEQVQALWDAAVRRFGRVDLWVNNAGLENRQVRLWELEPDEIRAVVDANLTAVMVCSRVAIRGMLAQGGGRIYNVAGMGGDGRLAPGLTVYSTTKYGLTFLTKALVEETRSTPVQIATINPGMVVTDMLLNNVPPERLERAKRFFNIVADRVETVSPWLAERMLTNRTTGAEIVWLTMPKMLWRMATARFRPPRDLFRDFEAGD